MSVDMGQYDAMKSQPRSKEETERVFADYKARVEQAVAEYKSNQKRVVAEYKARVERVALAAYIADYIAEEAARGNVEVDKWMLCDALEAYEGGAR